MAAFLNMNNAPNNMSCRAAAAVDPCCWTPNPARSDDPSDVVLHAIRAAFGSLAYMRGLLPSRDFTSHKVANIPYKIVVPVTESARTFHDWIETSIATCLRLRYLEAVTLCIAERDSGEVVEEHTIYVRYDEDGCPMLSGQPVGSGAAATDASPTTDASFAAFLRDILTRAQSLGPLPRRRTFTIRQCVVPGAPDEFLPPLFRAPATAEDMTACVESLMVEHLAVTSAATRGQSLQDKPVEDGFDAHNCSSAKEVRVGKARMSCLILSGHNWTHGVAAARASMRRFPTESIVPIIGGGGGGHGLSHSMPPPLALPPSQKASAARSIHHDREAAAPVTPHTTPDQPNAPPPTPVLVADSPTAIMTPVSAAVAPGANIVTPSPALSGAAFREPSAAVYALSGTGPQHVGLPTQMTCNARNTTLIRTASRLRPREPTVIPETNASTEMIPVAEVLHLDELVPLTTSQIDSRDWTQASINSLVAPTNGPHERPAERDVHEDQLPAIEEVEDPIDEVEDEETPPMQQRRLESAVNVLSMAEDEVHDAIIGETQLLSQRPYLADSSTSSSAAASSTGTAGPTANHKLDRTVSEVTSPAASDATTVEEAAAGRTTGSDDVCGALPTSLQATARALLEDDPLISDSQLETGRFLVLSAALGSNAESPFTVSDAVSAFPDCNANGARKILKNLTSCGLLRVIGSGRRGEAHRYATNPSIHSTLQRWAQAAARCPCIECSVPPALLERIA